MYRLLLHVPALAGVLGERQRIIANNWQATQHSTLAATILRWALEVAGRIDISPWRCAPTWPGSGSSPSTCMPRLS
jgi:hypothetical protein